MGGKRPSRKLRIGKSELGSWTAAEATVELARKGGQMPSDDQLRSAIRRLTENEREVLRRRLLPQTAKEMAIDLGVTPHAIEKRLKMARTKLALSSSLEAARQVARIEGYGRLVHQKADLAGYSAMGDDKSAAVQAAVPSGNFGLRRGPLLIGVLCMLVVLSTLIALASQTSTLPAEGPPVQTSQVPASAPPGVVYTRSITMSAPKPLRAASVDEKRAYLAYQFTTMDRDGSGYVERNESPVTYQDLGAIFAAKTPEERRQASALIIGPEGRNRWMARGDGNGDGKVSQTEYLSRLTPPVEELGGVPTDWPAPG